MKSDKKSKKSHKNGMAPVVFFEMPMDNKKRVTKFYTKVFGWKTKPSENSLGEYVIANTSNVDKKGRPKKTGIISGGFYTKKKNMPAQYPNVVIAVDDIDKSMKKIKKEGGKILGKPVDIPGYGLYVSFYDSEHNRVSIMEPYMN
jgi:predicted enzyme related to lactoylglutathione lyase